MRPVLALELSSDGIILHELSYDSKWRKLASVPLRDPFLPKKMAAMRVTARASQGRFFKNEVWIPPKQVIVIKSKMTATDPDARHTEAVQILRTNPDVPKGNYVIRLSKKDARGNTTIAAIEHGILKETKRFALGYKFGADGVTSSRRIPGFATQPIFQLEDTAELPIDFRKIGFAASILLSATAVISAGWWIYKSIDFSPDLITTIEATDNRVFSENEDPRAPIRPSGIAAVNAGPAPIAIAVGANLAPLPAHEITPVVFTVDMRAVVMNSVLEVGTNPTPQTTLNPIITYQEAPIWANIGRPDKLPTAEILEYPVTAAVEDENIADTPVAAPLVEVPDFDNTIATLQMLPAIIVRGPLAQAPPRRAEIIPVTQPVVTAPLTIAELQALPPIIANGPSPLRPLRRTVAETVIEPQPEVAAPLTLVELQALPPIIANGPSPLTPLLRAVVEAVVTPEPAPQTPPLTIAELQALPPIIATAPTPRTPLFRPVIAVDVEPQSTRAPLTIAELQALPPTIAIGPARLMPTLRPDAVALPPSAPIEPVLDEIQIASLQILPPRVLTAPPTHLPILRGGNEITGAAEIALAPIPETVPEDGSLRPLARPSTILEIAVANDPALITGAVVNPLMPLRRAPDFGAKIQALIQSFAETERTTPRYTDAPREVSLPTSANVSREATIDGGIDLNATSLIGVYGKPGEYRALIRQKGGVYTYVKIGDTLSGWTITAISENTVRIKKGSSNEVLRMPG
ncbi:MAG: hypothetical protein V3V13_12855 [Paracoccaceae bacterium]